MFTTLRPLGVSVVILFGVIAATWSGAATLSHSIYAAYFVPDTIADAGNLFLYLRNPTDRPLTISKITLNGQAVGRIWLTDESFLNPGVRDKYIQIENDSLAWYRVFPNPIPAGGIAEVILRLVPKASRQPECTLGMTLDGRYSVQTTVLLQEPVSSFEYVGIERGLNVLHLYVRSLPGARADISRVEIDGQPIAAQMHPLFSGYTYVRVDLEKPWEQGSFHAVAIGTTDDLRAVLIHALPSPPPIGIMGHGHESWLHQYATHLFQAHIAHVGKPAEKYDAKYKYGLVCAYPYGRYLRPEQPKKKDPVYFDYTQIETLTPVRKHPALWGYFLGDEPDGRHVRTDLPRLCISRDVERANQFCRIFDPGHMTYSTIDHSRYPRNVYRYGQIPDYIALHTFGVGKSTVVTSAQDHVMHTRLATRPRPFLFCCTGYSMNDGRIYDPREMQLEVYTALAGGAKSLQWYPAHGDRGLFKAPKMWNAVGEMNGILHQVLPLLSIGTPIGEPLVRGGNVLSRCILCGDQAMAVVLVNKDFTADAEHFQLRPADVTIRVRLPGFLDAAGAVEVRFPEQNEPVPAQMDDSSVQFTTHIEAGKMIVIYSREAVVHQMQHEHNRCLQRFVPVPEDRNPGPHQYVPSLVE